MPEDYLAREDDLGKIYDSRIVRRLYVYARPYAPWLFLALLLASLMSASQILLPYLTKIGIDSFIVIKDKRVDLTSFSPAERDDFLVRYADRHIALHDNQVIIREGILDPVDRKRLFDAGAVDTVSTYILDLDRYDENSREQILAAKTAGVLQLEPTVTSGRFVMPITRLDTLPETLRSVIRKPDRRGIGAIALVYVAILLLSLVVMFGQVYVLAWVGQKIMYDIRMKLFDHVQRLHLRFFNSQPTGRLVTRVSNDVNVLNEVFTSILVEMLKNVLMIVGITGVMLVLAPRLALVTFCVLPFMISVTWYFKRKMRDAYRIVRKKIALINATLAEHLSGIKVIIVFAREALHFNKFKEINRQAFQANMRELIIQSSFSPFIVFLENTGVALILYYGGGQVVQNAISLGTLIAFLNYLTMFFGPVRDIAEKFNIMQAAMASSERIFQLLDLDPEDAEDAGRQLLTEGVIRGDIEFRHVWFAYNGDDWVLKDVSFTVRAGETAAFVGATGSGKTTIINLLTRFYTIQSGEILLDGRNLYEYDRRFIRRNMAMVLQDVFLFSGDIYRNIRLNNSDISDEAIHDVARFVHADTFIERLDDRYEHRVEEGGATLSQGQRQLLAFARALAMDPALLILDEATANIDSETEKWIQRGLDHLLSHRTAVVVAHRLSTIKQADTIIVLHRGQVQEIGTHQSLLTRRGLYYRLYQLQFKQQEKLAT
ncbi:ABC transporter ATP-binding protein [bacterium]|nr:ABC transporter ATP-binding protein [candidate division CSSED10-310 bacterium]